MSRGYFIESLPYGFRFSKPKKHRRKSKKYYLNPDKALRCLAILSGAAALIYITVLGVII